MFQVFSVVKALLRWVLLLVWTIYELKGWHSINEACQKLNTKILQHSTNVWLKECMLISKTYWCPKDWTKQEGDIPLGEPLIQWGALRILNTNCVCMSTCKSTCVSADKIATQARPGTGFQQEHLDNWTNLGRTIFNLHCYLKSAFFLTCQKEGRDVSLPLLLRGSWRKADCFKQSL